MTRTPHANPAAWLLPFVWLVGLLLSTTGTALESDREQPIEISADRAELDEKNTSATYLGNVELRQGSLYISADSLMIKATAEGQVERVTARGKPATLRQQPDQDTPPITANADTIDYWVVEERITLSGNARAEQQANLFTGEVIQYDLQKKILQAFGRDQETGSGEGRVQMILQPKPRDAETPAKESAPE